MAIDKTDSVTAQVEVTKTAPKKASGTTKKAGSEDKKKLSQMQKVVEDAKSLYSDLDQSEGRKMRKRPASSAPAVAKRPKKTAAKKNPAVKKTAAKKGAAKGSEENKNE